MRINKLFLLLTAVALAAPAAAHAQDGVYVMYTGMSPTNATATYAPDMYGATAGFYLEDSRLKVVSAGVDFRASFLNGSNSTSIDGGLAGFRLVVRPRILPIMPYGEFLVGVASSSLGSKATTDFQTALVAGLDYTVIPHVDWRMVDFSYGRVDSANPYNPVSVSTGVVLRF